MSRRAKGDGSVYFDSSRHRWIGAADVGVNPKTGARRRVKVTGKPGESRSSVAARLRTRMVELEDADRSPETVGELIEGWRTRAAPKRKSDSTLAMTDSLIKNHITPVLGDVRLSKLDVETIEAFLDARADLSKSTLDKMKTILAQSFDFGIRRRQMDWNPARVRSFQTMPTPHAREEPSLAQRLDPCSTSAASIALVHGWCAR